MENQVTIDRLRQLFSIDPHTGIIIRLKKVQSCPAGHEAGGLSTKGYRQLRVDGRHIEGHRVAWALYYGEWPTHHIDHRNGVRDDNRRANLRPATREQNGMNRGAARNNTSGRKGVTWNKHSKKWMAAITANGRTKTLGHFADPDVAARAYQQAAGQLHGEFAHF